MSNPKANLYHPQCPSRAALSVIGSKWAMLLMCTLRRGPIRTGTLKREIGGISQGLRGLERFGIVQRIDYAEVPPRVEYKLTRMGRSLSDVVLELEEWVVHNYGRMAETAASFDAEQRAA